MSCREGRLTEGVVGNTVFIEDNEVMQAVGRAVGSCGPRITNLSTICSVYS